MKVVLIFLFSIHLLMQGAFCTLRSCSKENDANKVCRNEKSQNYPIELKTTLYLKEIVKINEEENSIKMQMSFFNYWTDSTLSASKTTES